MALTPLATAADLPAAWAGHPDASRALEVASSAIRDAAGHPIGQVVTTVTVTGSRARLLSLPGPVIPALVVIDGDAVDDYKTLPEGLWRASGWAGCEPSAVTVTGAFGFEVVPDDIVDLCAQLAAAWLAHETAGGGSTAGVKSVKVDDAAETYTDEAADQASGAFIPASTRQWLRARFGGGAVTILEVAL